MSGALFYDHHADLAGHRQHRDDGLTPLSARRKLIWLLLCSAGSWLIAIAPFLILA